MAAAYLEKLEALVGRLPLTPASPIPIECKHFFGGAAAYAGGRIFMTWSPAGLALKLPDARRAEWLEKGAAPLRYFPDGPIKKQYIVVPASILCNEKALTILITDSLRYVRSGQNS